MRRAHTWTRRILREWLEHGQVREAAPEIPVRVVVDRFPVEHPAARRPYLNVIPTSDDDAATAAVRVCFLLWREGARAHRCEAEAPRSTALCGRWFVGRLGKDYCSPACYAPAAARRYRKKRGSHARRKRDRLAFGSRLRTPEPEQPQK